MTDPQVQTLTSEVLSNQCAVISVLQTRVIEATSDGTTDELREIQAELTRAISGLSALGKPLGREELNAMVDERVDKRIEEAEPDTGSKPV